MFSCIRLEKSRVHKYMVHGKQSYIINVTMIFLPYVDAWRTAQYSTHTHLYHKMFFFFRIDFPNKGTGFYSVCTFNYHKTDALVQFCMIIVFSCDEKKRVALNIVWVNNVCVPSHTLNGFFSHVKFTFFSFSSCEVKYTVFRIYVDFMNCKYA